MKLFTFFARYRAIAIFALITALVLTFALSRDFYSNAQTQKGKGVDVPLSGTITGKVFQDYNGNGNFEATGGTLLNPTAVDSGVAGITASVYDSAGVLRGTATTNASGLYSIAATGTGPYRVEFTTLPAGYSPSARSTDSVSGGTANDSGSTVQFVADGNTPNVNLAINRGKDYCQDNPLVSSQEYSVGAASFPFSVFSIPYGGSGNTAINANLITYQNPAPTSLANANQVGTTFGLTYQRSLRRLFVSALMKKHVMFGPGGTGAIYQIDRGTGIVSEYVNLNTVFGANTAGANPHNTADYNTDNGNTTWDAAGKLAFGGLAISDDETKLFVMNLANRQLYRIPTSGTLDNTTIQSVAFPAAPPSCSNAIDVRPFSVNFYEGLVYVGAVCSAESSNNSANLRAYVYTVDPASLTFSGSPVFQMALNYPRGFADNPVSALWQPWRPTYQNLAAPADTLYPQPELTDLEFDRGNMILFFRDRNGEETGYQQVSNPANGQLLNGTTGGDILRACGSPVGGWTLESNARCGGIGGGPQNNNQGPGGGEYYYQDNYPGGFHDEVGVGAGLQIPGHVEHMASAFDPPYIITGDGFDSGGFRWFDNSTGARTRDYVAYTIGTNFGKANGIGSLVALCDPAPIEIGNRVWRDSNSNGVQDPGENGIAGVTVRLYQGLTLVGTAVTDANGEYYFVSSAIPDPNTTDNIGQVNGGILYNTAYQIRFDLAANYAGGGPLFGLSLAPFHQTTQQGSVTSSDSDTIYVANPPGSPGGTWPVISLTTGGPGANDHTFDAGFILRPTAADVSVQGRILLQAGYGIRNATVALTEANGTVHFARTGSFGYYRFDNIPGGQSVIVSVSSKRYTFSQPTRPVSLNDDLSGVDFIADQ